MHIYNMPFTAWYSADIVMLLDRFQTCDYYTNNDSQAIVYVDCISIVASTLQMNCDIDNEERIFVNQVWPCQNAFALE